MLITSGFTRFISRLPRLVNHKNIFYNHVRYAGILSQHYKLDDEWNKSLQNDPLLAKNDPNTFFSEIMTKLNNGERLYAVDLDIFVHVAKPNKHLEESIYLLSRFRRSLRAHTMLPSTHHALCRLFLESKKLSALCDVLDERVNYGIFPDHYTYNLLLDNAVENQDFCSGARITSAIMFQEEFNLNKITDLLSLYVLAKYVDQETDDFTTWKERSSCELGTILGDIADQSSNQGEESGKEERKNDGKEMEEDDEEDEEEIEYVRVPFIKADYFDDHFDLKGPREICGKTLDMLGQKFNDECGFSARILGLSYRSDWPKLKEFLEVCLDKGLPIYESIVSKSRELIENHESNDKEESETKLNSDMKYLLIDLLSKIKLHDGNLIQMSEIKLKQIPQLEQKDIEEARSMIQSWTDSRTQCLKDQIERILKIKRIKEIEEKRRELREKEQYLYFYENLRKKKATKIDYRN